MPRLSVWFVRTALLHLMAGFTVGALLLANKGLPLHPGLWRLLPAHIELLLLLTLDKTMSHARKWAACEPWAAINKRMNGESAGWRSCKMV